MTDAERAYADLNDASGAIETIDSGLTNRFGGKDRATWEQVYREKRTELVRRLSKIPAAGLAATDARAVRLMRTNLESLPENPGSSQPGGRCKDAPRIDLDYAALRSALYSCFDQVGANLEFEGARIDRLSALDMLGQIEPPERRKTLFVALSPLWEAINGKNQPDSPYRRLIRMTAADRAERPASLRAAAQSLNITPEQAEHWLEQILEAWRKAGDDHPVEPWDFHYQAEEADRLLAPAIPRESFEPIAERYYRDLGAGLERMGVLFDLDPRPGKAPVAYTEFARRGRLVNGRWRQSIARVSASYAHGGLSSLNEFVHENGHAIHIAAIRTRPAFMDTGDLLFVEAFADVPSWNTYEPAWQRRYIGSAATESASLRSLYSSVMLDAAWALFEIRMLRSPATDPNTEWTAITSRYLHIVPHPEWSWWATRGQLVDSPGYMINYGLGAVLTADLRQHVRETLGPFETGDPRWYRWISQRLLRYGMQRETSRLLREFLGRPVSPRALLAQMRRLTPAGN